MGKKKKIVSKELRPGTGRVFGSYDPDQKPEKEINFRDPSNMKRAFDIVFFDKEKSS